MSPAKRGTADGEFANDILSLNDKAGLSPPNVDCPSMLLLGGEVGKDKGKARHPEGREASGFIWDEIDKESWNAESVSRHMDAIPRSDLEMIFSAKLLARVDAALEESRSDQYISCRMDSTKADDTCGNVGISSRSNGSNIKSFRYEGTTSDSHEGPGFCALYSHRIGAASAPRTEGDMRNCEIAQNEKPRDEFDVESSDSERDYKRSHPQTKGNMDSYPRKKGDIQFNASHEPRIAYEPNQAVSVMTLSPGAGPQPAHKAPSPQHRVYYMNGQNLAGHPITPRPSIPLVHGIPMMTHPQGSFNMNYAFPQEPLMEVVPQVPHSLQFFNTSPHLTSIPPRLRVPPIPVAPFAYGLTQSTNMVAQQELTPEIDIQTPEIDRANGMGEEDQSPNSEMEAKLRFSKNASPSKYCHVCGRSGDTVPLASCSNVHRGLCRKVVCEKCLLIYRCDKAHIAFRAKSGWVCMHCRGMCPARARCKQYKRNNMKRRSQNQEKRTIRGD